MVACVCVLMYPISVQSLQDGLITAFFKPLVKRTIIDVDGPCIIASTSASVHDTSPRPSRPSTASPHAVESVPLVHVCQREPIEEKFTSRYLHSPPPRPVTTPTGGVGDLCDWREVPPTVQPLQASHTGVLTINYLRLVTSGRPKTMVRPNRQILLSLNMNFERYFSKLSENHKIFDFRSTEFKLWQLKEID